MRLNFGEIQLCKTDKYRLVGKSHMGILYLKLSTFQLNRETQNEEMRLFHSQIKLYGQHSQLQKWFDSLQDCIEYLRDTNNIAVDSQNKRIKLLSQMVKGRSKYVQIGEIKLKYLQISVVDELKQIVGQCRKENQLSMKQIRWMIALLGQNMIEMYLEKEKMEERGNQKIQEQSQQKQENQHKHMFDTLITKYSLSLEYLEKKMEEIDSEVVKLTENMVELTKIKNVQKQQTSSQTSTHEEIKVNKKIDKIQQFKKLAIVNYVDNKCKDYCKVNAKQNYLVVLGGRTNVKLFGKLKIKQKQHFSLKVSKLANWINIGIADRKLKDKDQLQNTDIHITYYNNHHFWDSKELMSKQGKGYVVGEIITVEVDLKLSIIRWKVGGEIRHQYRSELIHDRNIEWVPYIHLLSSGDSLYWIS